MGDFKDIAHKTVAELFDMLKEKQAEADQLKAEIEGLKNPNLAQHTNKYREQCELFKLMSEVEKKAYSAGYDWACKVSQRQILTLIKDQEGVEDKLDDEIDNLKAQLNNMEQCYIEKKKECEDQLNQTKDACVRYDRLYEEYRLLELLVGSYRVSVQEVLPRCSRELLENIEGWEKALRGAND